EFGWSVLRAVDHVNAGIDLKYWNAQEGQCLRRISRRLEWTTGAPEAVRAACLERRLVLQVAPPVLSVTPSAKRRYVDSRYSTLPLTAGQPQIEIEGRDIHLSCWKKAESGEGWVVRLYSLSESQTPGRLKTRFPVSAAFAADLDEKPQEKLPGSAVEGFAFEMGPKQIRTVLLMPDNARIEAGLAAKRTGG
ncbi:glycosyl hydrolase-related protein, partial [bacterium]|nr:glycosyl hydrolase-related protein [bacterium]